MARPKNVKLCTGRPRRLPWEEIRAAIRGGDTYRHTAWKFQCSLGAIHRAVGKVVRPLVQAPFIIPAEAPAEEWLRHLHSATAHLRPTIRDDVRQEMALSILSGDLPAEKIHEAIHSFAKRAIASLLTEENIRMRTLK